MPETEPLLSQGQKPELLAGPEVPEGTLPQVQKPELTEMPADKDDGIIREVPGMDAVHARPAEVIAVDPAQVAIAEDRIRKSAELLAVESAQAVASADAARSGQAVVNPVDFKGSIEPGLDKSPKIPQAYIDRLGELPN